jgi:hypothetical protein
MAETVFIMIFGSFGAAVNPLGARKSGPGGPVSSSLFR